MPSLAGTDVSTSSCSLKEQPKARRAEKPSESAAEIIPGDRGMEGGSWCRLPLPGGLNRRARQISPVPLAGVMTGQRHESGTERQGAIRNRARAELGPREVSTHAPTQLPRGLRLLLRRPERSRVSRRDDPAKRPRPATEGARK